MRFKIQPWAHQKEAIEFAADMKDLALFWEMGTGKTMTIINILRGKYQGFGRMKNTLILAPIVVLKNWREEIIAHADMNMDYVCILRGTGKQKAEVVRRIHRSTIPHLIIANYEVMQNQEIVDHLKKWKPDILVCDESHRCKSPSGKRAKAIADLAEGATHRYILTGTPILNSPMDIFQQFKILDGGETFGKSFWQFQKKYFYDKNAGMPKHKHFPDWQPKPGIHKTFAELIAKKALRAEKKDCLDLPPFIREERYVGMSDEQTRAYKEMRDEYITFIKGQFEGDKPRAVVASLAITKGLRLQQIVSGFCVTDDGTTVAFDNSPRITELKNLLEELTPTHKVIVWACFRENYKQIAKVCEKLGIEYAELHGGIKDKDDNLDRFRNDDNVRVVICNPQSAGLGVNLIESDYSIYFSKNFSLENDLQSEARNHRGGSDIHDKITRIDLVAAGTIDEEVTKALRAKVNIAEAILDWKL